jgi:hypothetical protein
MEPGIEVQVLRRLAAEYRRRSASEPDMAHTLRGIAEDLEARAKEMEPSVRK